MAAELVRYEVSDEIATLTMDDGKVNALSPAMIEALGQALSRAEEEGKAVVLAGRPGRFCAGFDLQIMMSGPGPATDLVRAGADLLMRMYAFPRPLVIACTGHAVAGGALVLLVGDTRICAEGEFKLGLNEVSIGMTLPQLAQELARDRLDPRYLVRAAVQSTIFAPQEAVAAGFVDSVAPADQLFEAASAEAKRLSTLPGQAYAATKERLRRRTIAHIRDTLEADFAEIAPPT